MAGGARGCRVADAHRVDAGNAEAGHRDQGGRTALARRELPRHVLREDYASRRQPDRSRRSCHGRAAASQVGTPTLDRPVTDMMPWLEGTAIATWVRESPSLWAYPAVLTLHTVGLGIVVGASAVIDLRLLGYAPRIRIGTLAPLFTFMAYAFVLNAATGIMLFMA